MRIGVDYYPEQWSKSLWIRDVELMASTGVKLVRIGEFAWSRLEPREGVFDFAWLDEVIALCSNYGIGVVLCTPTNCPPLWLYEKYPDIVRVGEDGNRLQLGVRGHRCINSPIFLEYAKRITEQLARRYGVHPSIKAWQIDNELEAYPCRCEACKNGFRQWLLDRFNDVDGINQAFGTSVWSGEYSSITQVDLPTAYPKAWQNPSLCLEAHRFASDSTVTFVRNMASIIRRSAPLAPITTNVRFHEEMPDFYRIFDNLDFASYDNYPMLSVPAGAEYLYSHSFELDVIRGMKEKNFWIMEQLSGPTGSWVPMSPASKPNMIKGYALQAIAHGADTVMHFRWRTACTGAEMHSHGILDHSNVPGRRYFEFADLCQTVTKLKPLENTEIVSSIAILLSHDSFYALGMQPQTENYHYIEQLRNFHRAFTRFGANIDVVEPTTDLSRYKIVVAPSLYVNDNSAIENIYRYVINGGTLVLTNRSGVKDRNNNCIMEPLPTAFRELVGAEVVEYDPIGDEEQRIIDFSGREFKCTEWCDILKLNTARAYAEYADSFYRSCPAVTVNEYCKGLTYYIGTVCDSEFYEKFASNLMKQNGVPRLNGLPVGVEITTRTNGNDEFIFFFNNSPNNTTIGLPKHMFSIIDSAERDRIELKPFEMDIVRK